ncbi:TonB-dependent receptor [Robertkochia marina]|uniref:TonB-dependent receptor n=1 Tax=Robertkochia marina TaxID=1227945 RepID=A0A4S3M2E4_9FLAO|nr:outer membrane beta-barrel family protein [Robertkochia marina]THD69292.1 TonB-dependent receptor [Robertkochia marina]TRZ47449.1 TonB-dependent receptor [Robertkochia marina]
MRQPLLYAISIFFLYISKGYAQEYELSGRVDDQEGRPMSFVNVLLLKVEDSTMIKGVSTMDDGGFLFENVANGNYLLKSSYVGFQTDLRNITVNGNTDAGSISLLPATEDLQGVTVSYRKPSIEKKPDRLVFNVANTTLSALSGYEIIKRTPGVIVMNDQIIVKNTSPVIYLNEKRVYLSDNELRSLLNGYAGANIEAIEVITNPPARYDAEGSVVLNIITRSNVSIGYKGSLEGRGTYAVFPKYNFNTQHYYKTKGIDFFFNYNYNREKLNKNDNNYINFSDEGSGQEFWETDLNRITRVNDQSVNSILDIATGEESSLTLSANLSWSPDKRFNNTAKTEIINAEGLTDFSFDTESFLENDTYNYVFGAEYQSNFGEGANWNTRANYIYFQQEQFQELATTFYDAGDNIAQISYFETDGRQKNNIFTLQSDLIAPVGAGTFSTGLKYAKIDGSSGIDFTGISIPNGAISDDFEYGEKTYAAYMDYSWSADAWDFQLGSRVEHTDVIANSIALGEVNTQKYLVFVPSLGVQFTPGEHQSYGVSYGRSISRPGYQSLNPFRYYIVENQYREGNPLLTRTLGDKIALSYSYKQLSFELSYEHIKGALELLPFQNNTSREFYASRYNIDYSKFYSLDFLAPLSLNRNWFAVFFVSAFYAENSFLAKESGNVNVQLNTPGLQAYTNHSFTLGKKQGLTLDAIYIYLSNYLTGSRTLENQHFLNLSLRQRLWDGRAFLSLGLDDVFNTQNVPLESRYLNQDNGFFAREETRRFFISFRYNFGNFRLDDNNRNTDPTEVKRVRE